MDAPQPATAPPSSPSSPGRSVRGSRPGKLLLAALIGAVVVAFVAGWALPNIAGPAFVQVRAVATVRTGTGDGPTVAIGGQTTMRSGALNVTVELTNLYPLAVVLGASPTAFKAAIYRHDGTTQWTLVWHQGAADPIVEEGSDSPVGGGSAGGAASVPSGITRHQIANGSTAFPLVDARGLSISPGVYYLRVWGYGIGSPLVSVAIGGATDASGIPADLPAEPN
jgi:hypothetical protein